jgi:hypothetical protein
MRAGPRSTMLAWVQYILSVRSLVSPWVHQVLISFIAHESCGNKCSDIIFFPKLFASGLTPMIPSFELVHAGPSRARSRVPQSSSTHVTSVVHYCIATPTAPVLRRMCYEFLRYHEPSIYRPLSPPPFPNPRKIVVMDNDWTYAVGVYDVN